MVAETADVVVYLEQGLQGCNTMKTREEILSELREMLPDLRTGYKVLTIGLFGSAVRNETASRSDIDLLVEFAEPIGLFRFMDLEEMLSVRFGAKVDLVSRKALKPEIGRSILGEVVLA